MIQFLTQQQNKRGKMKKIISAAGIIGVSVFLLSSISCSLNAEENVVSKNIVSDPGFEQGDGINTETWKGDTGCRRDTVNKHSGKYSAEITSDAQIENPDIRWWQSGMPINEGKYEISLWYMTKEMTKDPFITFYFKDEGGKEVGRADPPGLPRENDGKWHEFKYAFSVPSSAKTTELLLRFVGKGTVWFDDISLQKKVE